ncbi:MAG: urease accessory protein UreH [Pyrinomonadaceae bacterium]|nr:urease accessory protein UreH [Pyrinomonadaceae bacterium]
MDVSLTSVGVLALLGLGLIFGLKHATEVDHVVAVSTIVSQSRSLLRSAMVGVLWGAGHTAALLVTGAIVLSLRVTIPESISNWLEFCVALMILGLGASALWRAVRKGREVHLHKHSHDGVYHVHVHFHEATTRHGQGHSSTHTHAVSSIGIKPVLVGTMHGFAGSGALTLLVLAQIKSPWLGLLYLAIFGVGSIVGMLLMSGLIGLPFALTSRNLSGLHHRFQAAAAVLSIAFGLWYAYQTGLPSGLF